MRQSPSPGGWHVPATLAVALLATLAVLFGGSPLPRITPDSATYLTGAERIAAGDGFDDCSGPVAVFAPGYPAALAVFVALGASAPDAARIVNALATFALVLGAALLARGSGLTANQGFVATLAVALSFATLRNGALVWSEPLFCALLTWLLVLVVAGGRGLAVRASWRITAVVALAWAVLLVRHSGVFLVPAVLLGAWLGSRALERRMLRVAVLGLVVLAAPALWWLRDVHVEGSPFGRRSGSLYGAVDVLRQFPDGLSSLTLPNALPLAVRILLVLPLVAAAVLAWPRSAGDGRRRLAVSVLALAVVVYAVAVTVAAMRTIVDPIDARLLSPILAPGAVLVALGVAGPRSRLERALAWFALLTVGLVTVLAPGVAWRSHQAGRDLGVVEEDVGCADWPALYSGR